MMDLLQHLMPDFSQLFTGHTHGISAWFWLATATIFFLSMAFVLRHFFHFRRRMIALRSLLEGQSKENLARARRETLQKAMGLDARGVGMLWREFDESLVSSGDQKQLFNTLDAEHFFNSRTLASGLTASRLLAAAPSFLVAIGVLGTFVGLTVGLEGLVGTSDEIDALKGGINKLIAGAAVAFMTSVWGVAFSLALNFIEKMFERHALSAIQDLQHEIDFLYPRMPAEQSLVLIAEYGKESKEALQELHERIGDRLQETLSGMSDAMQQAMTDALNNIMAPAIQTLVSSTSQQSSQVMEKLVGNFMEGMTSVGREQGSLMQQAAADVNAAVGSMTERLNQLFSTLTDQQTRQLESAQIQSSEFEAQLERLSSSAEQRQQQLENRFAELLGGLTVQLDSQMGAAEQREQARAQRHEEQQAATLAQQQQLIGRLGQASQQQISAIAEASASQQRNLEETIGKLLVSLNEQMTGHGQQAELREQSRQQRFNEQLDSMAAQQQELLKSIAHAVQTTQQQSQQMAVQHQQLMNHLEQATAASATSSKHMESSASQLGLLSANLRQASDVLGQRLEVVTQTVENATAQNAALAAQLQSQASTLSQLQAALLEGAQRFEQAASEARSGFGEMKQTQHEFLSGVKHEFTALGEALRSQVQAVEKQAEEWLRSYAGEVRHQIDDRMTKWNDMSLTYADQMHRTVQAMSGILDELEAR